MRARAVAARDERRALVLDALQRRDDVLLAFDAGRDRSSARSGRSRCTSPDSASRQSPRRGTSPPPTWRARRRRRHRRAAPVSSAWPVPCATTFTSMPVFALNSGRMWPNRPESCVEVVEATTIDLSCARAGASAASERSAASDRRRASMASPPCCLSDRATRRR